MIVTMDNVNETSPSTVANVGLEAIAFQDDRKIIEDLSKQLDKLRDVNINNRKLKNKDFLKRTDTLPIVKEMDRLLSKRFGLNIITKSTDYGPCIYPISPKEGNVLYYGKGDSWFKWLESLKTDKIKDDEMKHTMEIYKESHKALGKSLKKGVTIDNKNAKIKGLDKKVISILCLNFADLFNYFKFTNDEIISIILHEMGHAYNAIAYSYSAAFELFSLTENIGQLAMNNKKDQVIELMCKETKTNKDEVKTDKDKAKLIINLINQTLDGKSFGGDFNVTKENERHSDIFASRFGLQAELSSALTKLNVSYYTAVGIPTAAVDNFMMVIFVVFGFPFALLFLILKLLITLMTGNVAYIRDYDKNKDRLEKLLRETILNIRQTDISDETKEQLIKDVDSIRTNIKEIARYEDTWGSKIDDILMGWFNKDYNQHQVTSLLRNAIDNDLYVTKTRLDTIIEG